MIMPSILVGSKPTDASSRFSNLCRTSATTVGNLLFSSSRLSYGMETNYKIMSLVL